MSPGAVSDRVQRLENAGVIRGYHADVDPAALGYSMRVLIGVSTEQGPPVAETIEALSRVPEVIAVHVVSGQWDLVVVAQVRDQRHLRDLVIDGLWGIPGFRHSETMLILDSHTNSGAWMVQSERDI
jgi:DNA-binding Lrp family transcriptional regulator